jgi:formylglycine-generating enzyme required for sulfatase activity
LVVRPKGRRLALLTACVGVVVLGVATWLSFPHLSFWYLFEPLGVNAQGYREYRHRQTGIVMVRLPGGTFWMGAQRTDPNGRNYAPDAEDNEGPVHEVTLSPFLIGKFALPLADGRRLGHPVGTFEVEYVES